MQITEIRVKLINRREDRLKAYCAITFDDEFVVRDVRVVDGINGLFVAMPSRKASVPCQRCNYRNHMHAHFCNDCGGRLAATPNSDSGGRTKPHRDVAHPITPAFRELLQARVIEAFREEMERAQEPDYDPNEPENEVENEDQETEEVEEIIPRAVEEAEEEIEEVFDQTSRNPRRQGSGSVTEYDALIADLRKKTGGVERAPQPPQPVRRTGGHVVSGDSRQGIAPTTPQQRSKPQSRPRMPSSDDSLGNQAPRTRPAETRSEQPAQMRTPPPSPPKVQRPAEAVVRGQRPPIKSEETTNKTPVASVPRAVSAEKVTPAPVRPPAPSPAPETGATPFGAGIL
ncbi:MAG: septation protein SpoVG family protein [Planctomycetota bacterium]